MNELYPSTEPYDAGYYYTSQRHCVYFEQCGNQSGYPIFFLHGGPGAGCTKEDRRFFSPEKWRAILFDQRGCGRSKPLGYIEQNTTHHLACDIAGMMKGWDIDKAVIFGGSWGSLLALYFAINWPEKVAGLILRGVFLGEKSELDFLYKGGNKMFFPEAWERFLQNVPPEKQNDILGYFYERMTSGTEEEKNKFAFELSRFEEHLLRLEPRTDQQTDEETEQWPYAALGLLEAHYFVNNCFMDESYILDEIHRVPKVPISIVQGRYDMVCPPDAAWRLTKALRNNDCPVKLNIVQAGHDRFEPAIQEKLIMETNRIHSLITQKTR